MRNAQEYGLSPHAAATSVGKRLVRQRRTQHATAGTMYVLLKILPYVCESYAHAEETNRRRQLFEQRAQPIEPVFEKAWRKFLQPIAADLLSACSTIGLASISAESVAASRRARVASSALASAPLEHLGTMLHGQCSGRAPWAGGSPFNAMQCALAALVHGLMSVFPLQDAHIFLRKD